MAKLVVAVMLVALALGCDHTCLGNCQVQGFPLEGCNTSCGCGMAETVQTGARSALLVDQILPMDGCDQRCQSMCTTEKCLSQCLTEFCPMQQDGSVMYFFMGVILCMGLVCIAYNVLYSKSIKAKQRRKEMREDATHYVSL